MRNVFVALTNLTDGDLQSVIRLLKLMAKEASAWADNVPDRYRPRQTEPGSSFAHPGSNTAYKIGDLRRARVLVEKMEVDETRKVAKK